MENSRGPLTFASGRNALHWEPEGPAVLLLLLHMSASRGKAINRVAKHTVALKRNQCAEIAKASAVLGHHAVGDAHRVSRAVADPRRAVTHEEIIKVEDIVSA